MDSNAALLLEKLELIQWLSTVEDSAILKKISELRKKETVDWWNSISEQEKKSIELGLQDADEGKLNSHDKAKEVYGKWL
jgi:predicted transcriptional regulator